MSNYDPLRPQKLYDAMPAWKKLSWFPLYILCRAMMFPVFWKGMPAFKFWVVDEIKTRHTSALIPIALAGSLYFFATWHWVIFYLSAVVILVSLRLIHKRWTIKKYYAD